MKVNEKLRLLRESRQWSQEEMANKLSMSTKGYAKIERGETRSNLPRLEQISEIFDMDVCELLSYGEEGRFSVTHSDHTLNYSVISLGNSNLESEIHSLQLMLAHKDEIISHKENIIETQQRELSLLRELIETLKRDANCKKQHN
ncbi:transcriptional regulator [Pasteurellaceae bacterium 15-036681]|nr:transcriptional regulator [Pasteurellaceae bacterium 15-036681]